MTLQYFFLALANWDKEKNFLIVNDSEVVIFINDIFCCYIQNRISSNYFLWEIFICESSGCFVEPIFFLQRDRPQIFLYRVEKQLYHYYFGLITVYRTNSILTTNKVIFTFSDGFCYLILKFRVSLQAFVHFFSISYLTICRKFYNI